MTGTGEAHGDRVVALERAVEEARRNGDGQREASLLSDVAVAQLAAGRVGRARTSLREALALHRAADHEVDAAKVLYAIALLDGRDPAGGTRAAAGFESALGSFRAADEHRMVGRTEAHLATLLWRDGRYAEAGARLAAAEAAFVEAGDLQHAMEARRLRAFMLVLEGDATGAYRCLADAAADARRAGSEGQVLELEFDLQRLCRSGLVDPEMRPPSLAEMLQRADAAGKRSLAGHMALSRAAEHLAQGQIDEAEVGAEDARRRALGGPDPVLYLLACLLLARIHEERGDDVALLTILFTCQASLGDLLGEAARQPVRSVVSSVERRWGEKRFAGALAAYRQQFEQAGSS